MLLSKLTDLAARPDFRLGSVLVSPSRRRIEGPGGAHSVEPLIMQVLILLLDARGSVVTRSDLFEQCWGGVVVGDDSLNRAVASVRRVLGEAAPGAFELETIPRTGYRLKTVLDEGPNGDRADLGQPPLGRRAILSLAAGAAALGGIGVWSLLRPRADPRVEALIERGRAALREERDVRALAPLRQATAIDPQSAEAWGLLAFAAASVGQFHSAGGAPQAAALAEAERASRRAFVLDDEEPNALTAMVLVQHRLLDWVAVEDRLRRVLAIDSDNTLAMNMLVALLQATGRNLDSWNLNERLIAIEPLSPSNQFRRAFKHWIAGRNTAADQVIDGARDLWPEDQGVWFARFILFAFTGRPRAALALLQQERQPVGMTAQAASVWSKALVALDQRSPSAIAIARDALRAGAQVSPGIAAHGVMILGQLGEIDSAFDVANGYLLSRGPLIVSQPKARQLYINNAHWRWTQWLFVPPTAGLRADPRFGPLCDGVGLTEYWRKRGIRPDYLRA